MKKLKRLIETGSDTELLNYVRGNFSTKIDGYLKINGNLLEMKKRYVEIAESGVRREAELNKIIQKLNVVLDRLKKQTN
ncbi:hypothetical protein SDC9_47666 [bioreactor metagenome]|uniref:Uncharacterized protein n=1 Tax=bioreactor metagenome TaxID=1076179 RepID=A0A644WC71_9ZZZZ